MRVVQFGKNFTLPNVSSSVNYDFTETRSLYMSYASNARIPSIQQLAPVENRTNLQNIITLNPDLDVTQQHEIYLSFNSYDWESGNGIYAGGGLTLTQDQVGTVTLTGADLTRRTTYVNLNDGYNGWFYGSYSRTFKKDKRTFSTELGLNGNLSQNFGFTNGVEFQVNTLNLTPSLGLNRSIKDLIKLRANYDLGFQHDAL